MWFSNTTGYKTNRKIGIFINTTNKQNILKCYYLHRMKKHQSLEIILTNNM